MTRGVGAWLGLLTSRPSQPHGALRGKSSGDDDDGRAREEQGDSEVQDEVPGAELGCMALLHDSTHDTPKEKRRSRFLESAVIRSGCGGRIRTDDLRVMSPRRTSLLILSTCIHLHPDLAQLAVLA